MDLFSVKSITSLSMPIPTPPVGGIPHSTACRKFSSTGWKTLIDTCRELQNNNEQFHSAKSFQKAFITDIIQEFIDSNHDVKPIFVEGSWLEIDTLQDLNIAKKKLRD